MNDQPKTKEIPATINVHQFAKAMQDFDARGIPPHKLAQARYDHFLKVMIGSMSPYHANKVVHEAMAQQRRQLARATRRIII